jgi:hypothetical protein
MGSHHNTNDNFYIAAYNSSAAGAARDAKRSLAFSGYSSEEESPYAPAIRKARALERRHNVMAAEETVKSNLLFQRMGISTARDGDSDDDDEEKEEQEKVFVVGKPVMPTVIEQQIEEDLSRKLAAAKEENELLTKRLQAFQAEKAGIEDKLKRYQDQVTQLKRVLDEKTSAEQSSAAEVTTLRTKTELLERQVATLQASGERAEAERGLLAAENTELTDKLRETVSQLAKSKADKSTDSASAVSAAMELAQKREERLQSEMKNLQEELAVVQNALKASNEAAEAASRRANAALVLEAQAQERSSAFEQEKMNADRVADEAFVEAEYLRGEISKLEREVAVIKEHSATAIATADEQLASALVDTVNAQAEKTTLKQQSALNAAVEKELRSQIQSLTDKMEIMKQQSLMVVVPTIQYSLSPVGGGGGVSGGGSRCGLFERKRPEFSNIDLESGENYESDSSHDGEERGPLTALALRFGASEPTVNVAKSTDRATLSTRKMLQRQQRAVLVLGALYLLALHVLLVTGRMCRAI